MKIYTKTGDHGETGLADGKRYAKSEEIFWLMGEIDELNGWLGLCSEKYKKIFNVGAGLRPARGSQPLAGSDRSPACQRPRLQCLCICTGGQVKLQAMAGRSDLSLRRIQNNLFTVNSILARAHNIKFNSKKETEWLEKEIDKMTEELPDLRNFILPGGSEIVASLHVARAVCRRAERRLFMYQHVTMIKQSSEEFVPYFNRLSDYLFTLARFVNFKMGEREEIWKG